MKFGMDAIIAAGFPYEFDAVAMLESSELNVSLALRVGQPPNAAKGFPVSPKPLGCKANTCTSDGLLNGYIACDQKSFGRHNRQPLPATGFKPLQLNVSLYEILADTARGVYTNLVLKDNVLEFKFANPDNEAKKDILFSINLNTRKNALRHDNETLRLLNPWNVKPELTKPSFWNDRFGNFNDVVDDLYPVVYKQGEADFHALNIFATLDNIPITGDVDILWVAIPIQFSESIYHQRYNTAQPNELAMLINKCKNLCAQIMPQASPSLFQQIEDFAKNAGIITPYELLLERLVNAEFSKRIKHFVNLLQHGPETNKLDSPSALKSVLLLHNGLPVLTESEDELIQFVLEKDYLENYYVPIPPTWNIDKWYPVIKRQLELGQHVELETLNNYSQHEAKLLAQTCLAQPAKQLVHHFNYKSFVACGLSFYKSSKDHLSVLKPNHAEQTDNFVKPMRLVA